MTLALVLYQPVCLRCGGPMTVVEWDQPALWQHGWRGDPLDYRMTVRICQQCGAARRPDVRAVAIRRDGSMSTTLAS